MEAEIVVVEVKVFVLAFSVVVHRDAGIVIVV